MNVAKTASIIRAGVTKGIGLTILDHRYQSTAEGCSLLS